MSFWKSIPVFLLFGLAACSTVKKTTIDRTLDTLTVSANNNPMDIYREAAPHTWDIIHTDVQLTFNLKDRTANGIATIVLQPYCCAQDSIVLDAKGMKIEKVEDQLANWVPIRFNYKDNKLVIYKKGQPPISARTISGSASPGTANYGAAIRITYKAMPYADTASGGSAAINDDRGLYFINTDYSIPGKPAQIWTQGESESNSHWMPTIDKPNERFMTRIILTVPDSFQTLSNGIMTASDPPKNGLRTDIWEMRTPIQAYAVMFAIGKYEIIKDKSRNKDVNYYVEPEYAPYAKDIFRHTPEMMDFFSAITGVDYPWNKYSQVVARDYVSGAMENTSASLFGEFVNQTSREIEDHGNEDVVAHELFHQWFGDYVTFESWSNLTLSESFANYGEQLWRRHYYGNSWADELAITDLEKYLNRAANTDPELVRFHYRDREDMFDHVSYNKGGAILNYMKGLMGDSLFFKSMNIYLTENALQSAEASQWRLAVEQATGKDWNVFFNQWYYRAGHPVLGVTYNYDDVRQQLLVTVRQRNSPDSNVRYDLSFKTGIINGREPEIEDWNIKKRTETFTYKYKDGRRPVIVPDYYHWLPGAMVENKKPDAALVQFRTVTDYINKRRALLYAQKNFKDSSAKLLFREALNDTIPGIRLFAVSLLGDMPLQESFRQQMAFLAVQDPKNRVRAAAFSCLGEWKINSMNNDLLTATDDRSYAVSGAALNALYAVDEARAYEKAKSLLLTGPKAEQERAIWRIIAAQAQAADFYIFREKANLAYGNRRVDLADYLSDYLTTVKDAKTFTEGLALLDKLFHDEIILNYKKSIFSSAIQRLFNIGGRNHDKLTRDVIKARKSEAKTTIQLWLNDLPEKAANRIRLNEQLN